MTPSTAAGRGLYEYVVDPDSPSDYIAGLIRQVEAEARTEALAAVLAALTSEDEIAHGEAWNDNHGHGYGLGECAYDDEKWPCRTQRGIARLLATLDATRPSGDEAHHAEIDAAAWHAAVCESPTGKARPSGDEALRAALDGLPFARHTPTRRLSMDDDPLDEECVECGDDWPCPYDALRAALATPSSTPDVEGLRETAFDALVEYHGKSACRESSRSWERAAEALAALRDSRS